MFLQRKHKPAHENYLQAKQSNSTASEEQTSLLSYVAATSYSRNHPRQIGATSALVSLIAENMLPLSIVESPAFKKYSAALDSRFVVPSRKHVSTKLLTQKNGEIQEKIHRLLDNATMVSLTLDLWSNRQMRGFLGITCHLLQDWNLTSLMLTCTRFKGSHTAENIAQVYEDVLAEYRIENKFLTAVTDNAANVVKAFNLPGFGSTEECDASSSSESDDEDHENDDPIGPIDLHDSMFYVPTHITCFAHTLQLVVNDGLKEARSIERILAKVAKIIAFVRKSIIASDILEGERRLQTKVATRWNSALISIRSFLEVSQDKLRQLDTVTLTSYERRVLRELVDILTPFQEATDFTQGQKVVTSSFVLPCIQGLRKALKSFSATYKSGLVPTLASSLETRMCKYEENTVFVFAAILDPRFKLKWCDPIEVDSIKLTFILAAKRIHNDSASQSEPQPAAQPEDQSQPPPAKKRKESELLNYIFSETEIEPTSSSSTATSDIDSEIEKYLSSQISRKEDDPLKFWKENELLYPTLSKMAQCYLSIPATSAPVERLFSSAGKIFRPERCRLSDNTFHKLINIKCNSHL